MTELTSWAERLRNVRAGSNGATVGSSVKATAAPAPGMSAVSPAALENAARLILSRQGRELLDTLVHQLRRYTADPSASARQIQTLSRSDSLADRIDAARMARRLALVSPAHHAMAQKLWRLAETAASSAGLPQRMDDLRRDFLDPSVISDEEPIHVPASGLLAQAFAVWKSGDSKAAAELTRTFLTEKLTQEEIVENAELIMAIAHAADAADLIEAVELACVDTICQRPPASSESTSAPVSGDGMDTAMCLAAAFLGGAPGLATGVLLATAGKSSLGSNRDKDEEQDRKNLSAAQDKHRRLAMLPAARALHRRATDGDLLEQARRLFRMAAEEREAAGNWSGACEIAREAGMKPLAEAYALIISTLRGPEGFQPDKAGVRIRIRVGAGGQEKIAPDSVPEQSTK